MKANFTSAAVPALIASPAVPQTDRDMMTLAQVGEFSPGGFSRFRLDAIPTTALAPNARW